MEYVLIFALVYFMPILMAWYNKKKNSAAIAVINLFLGWTFIGWVVALAMAVGKEK